MHHVHLVDHNLTKSALYCSTSIASCILLVKIYGFWVTDSMTLLASVIDSMLDIFSSLINLIAVILAIAPPDNNHRFGKNKIEDLAIFAQSIFFFALGAYMIFSAMQRFITPQIVSSLDTGINVMIISMMLTAVLLVYQSYVLRKTKSRIVTADKLHYFGDFLSNAVAIISLYLSAKWYIVDAICSIFIAIYIIVSAYKLFIQAVRNLIDHEFSKEDKSKILQVLARYSHDVYGVHELKTRYAGNKPFIQFHLEMPGDMSLLDAHKISDNITAELEALFIGAEVIIHQDPAGVEMEVKYREVL